MNEQRLQRHAAVLASAADQKLNSRALVTMGKLATRDTKLMCRESRISLRLSRLACNQTRYLIAAYRLIG